MTIALPFPPSLNNAYVNLGRRRVKSRRYTQWQAQAAMLARAARVPMITQWPVEITITLHPPNRCRRDGDNLMKPVLDALVYAGVLPDDSRRYVSKATWQWGEINKARPEAIVEMKEAAPGSKEQPQIP